MAPEAAACSSPASKLSLITRPVAATPERLAISISNLTWSPTVTCAGPVTFKSIAGAVTGADHVFNVEPLPTTSRLPPPFTPAGRIAWMLTWLVPGAGCC